MRTRFFAVGLVAGGLGAVMMVIASAAGGETQDSTISVDCVGLTCAKPGSRNDVPQARDSVTSVSGPRALERRTTAGFYEFGRGTLSGKRAVAYVLPSGQLDRMPASVRDLPIVKEIEEPGDHPGFDFGTLVIFGPDVVLTVPQNELTPVAASKRRLLTATRHPRNKKRQVRSRAAARDAYGCEDGTFCLYDLNGYTGRFMTFGNSLGVWYRLSDYGFGDDANSMRNRRGWDSLLARDWPPGSSPRYCADSHSADSTFNDNAIQVNEASSTANLRDDQRC